MTVRRVEAVLFDAGGTLIRVEPSAGHVYAREASRFGVHCPPEALNDAFHMVWRRLRANLPFETSEDAERAFWRQLVRDTFAVAGAGPALDGHFEEFFAHLFGVFAGPEVWRVFDDVWPALGALRAAGIRCAVVSNWDGRLPGTLAALGLAPYFEFIHYSALAGRRKPDPLIFTQALERLHCAPDQALHVGDSPEEDGEGAGRAGIRALLIDRGHNGEPEKTIGDLRRLQAIVEG